MRSACVFDDSAHSAYRAENIVPASSAFSETWRLTNPCCSKRGKSVVSLKKEEDLPMRWPLCGRVGTIIVGGCCSSCRCGGSFLPLAPRRDARRVVMSGREASRKGSEGEEMTH